MSDVEKIVASLAASDERRELIKKRFGFVPSSVLREIHRGELSRRIFHYGREQGINKTIGERAEKKGGVYLHPRLSGQGDRSTRERNPEHFSIMPPELVDFFVRFYAAPGQTYLDPFAGQGVRMQVAKIRGLHYRATDISVEFTSFIDAVKAKIDDGKTVIEVARADARPPTGSETSSSRRPLIGTSRITATSPSSSGSGRRTRTSCAAWRTSAARGSRSSGPAPSPAGT